MPDSLYHPDEHNSRRVAINIYANEKQPVPKRQGSVEWERFALRLLSHDIRQDKSGPAFGPYSLIQGGTRRNTDVDAVSALVIDSDNGVPLDDLSARFPGLHAAIHTTHSHSPDMTKARVVIPLLMPVHLKEWPAFLEGAKAHFGPDIFDPATKDPARLYYLPSCPPEMAEHRRSMLLKGKFLDPRPFIERGGAILTPSALVGSPAQLGSTTISDEWKANTPPTCKMTLDEAEGMLRFIDPDCDRGTWWKVMGALVHEFGEDARDLARRWSMGLIKRGGA